MLPPPPKKGPTRTQTSSSPDLRQLHVPHWREQGKYELFPGTTAVAAGPQATSCHTVAVAVEVKAGMVVFCGITDAQHLQAEENCPERGQWLAANVGTEVGTMIVLFRTQLTGMVRVDIWVEGDGAPSGRLLVYR